jgi:hypothetical protein
MKPMRWGCCFVLAACGRLGFDPLAPPSPCSGLDEVLFCETFEGESMLPTEDATAPGFVRTDEEEAFRGLRSLHARTTGANEPAWRLGAALPDVVDGELFVRWYLYLPSSVANPQMASVHVVDSIFPFGGIIFGIQDGRPLTSSSITGGSIDGPVPVPRDRWFCVQLHIVISETAGVVETTVDGEAAGTLEDTDTLPQNNYRNLHAGLFATSLATGPQELWTDELVAAREPIPCE